MVGPIRGNDPWIIGFAASKAALVADPSDAEAHLTLGMYYLFLSQHARSLAEVEQALISNPNNADVLATAGGGMLPWLGRPEQGVELVRGCPPQPTASRMVSVSDRNSVILCGRFQEAIAATDGRTTPAIWDHQYRALSFAQLDRGQEAAREVAMLLETYPDYSAEKYISEAGTYARDSELNLFLDSHRKAGLPVCATEAQLAKYPDMNRLEQCEAERASG